jgi:glucose/mannose-6-phosphate isomerase
MADMRDLIERFPEQLEESARALREMDLSDFQSSTEGFNPTGILLLGMGGSGIGGAIASGILANSSAIPVISSSDYSIPGWVTDRTLVIACSYSGNTEETIEAVTLANDRNSKIAVVTSGGILGDLASKHGWPSVSLPGGLPPRSQFGRSFMGLAWVLNKYGAFSDKMYAELEATSESTKSNSDTIEGQAAALADLVEGKNIMLYTDTAAAAIATRWRQQLNENSKLLVNTQEFPEMNHNELVGWNSGNDSYVAVIIRTPEDHERSHFRMELSAEIFREFGADVVIIDADGSDQMQRLMYLIQLGDYLSLLLAERAEIDPVDITNIIRLKNELSSLK